MCDTFDYNDFLSEYEDDEKEVRKMEKAIYNNYKDIEKGLSKDDEEITTENYRWWIGVLDGCQLCGRINVDEKYQLLNKLEEKFANIFQ